MSVKQKRKNNKAPLIEVHSVSFSYDRKNTGRALNRVSFFVDRGERVAVLGHNGSGKSTLVKILGGIIEPSEGTCSINGRDIQSMDFSELRRSIGMVFQDPENQIVAAIVEDDVAFAPENQGLPPDDIQLRVETALAETDMLHKKDSPVEALSGGEKQRVALAGVLAADVECLILDEPTAMLDPEARINIEKVLRYLHAEGMTVIQVTHQIEAENFSDIQRVIVLSKGQVKWQGNVSDFWNNAEDLGFTVPDSLKVKRYCDSHGLNIPGSFADFNSRIIPPPLNSESTAKSLSVKFGIEALKFGYDNDNGNKEKKFALNGINAEIYSGEWLSIIGRTGSGKSTLVQHFNALYKIQEGKIFFDGGELPQKGEEIYALRQKVGLVFQHPEDQLFSANVRDELAFAPKNAGFKGKELDDAVKYGLECVSLGSDFLERNPIALSGGERRLVAIASVLAVKPECIVLDEPLAGLDASYQQKILAMLAKLRDEGRTVITVTHDLNMALRYSDRILILRDGHSVKEGKPREITDEIMRTSEPEAWPEILRISADIRKFNPEFPLIFDYQEFIQCVSQI
ncbi:MAG: ATP-binding cassette domain-containing protein [Synergistaceae bacterium]|nr:ATP-binding cassette domain-containing protein [Synergistaceae bacterium]